MEPGIRIPNVNSAAARNPESRNPARNPIIELKIIPNPTVTYLPLSIINSIGFCKPRYTLNEGYSVDIRITFKS